MIKNKTPFSRLSTDQMLAVTHIFSCKTLKYCVGFTWQGFGSRGGCRVGSVRRHQELPPCQTELVSACFKTDPMIGKAEPIRDSDGASLLMYLRKGKRCWAAAVRE